MPDPPADPAPPVAADEVPTRSPRYRDGARAMAPLIPAILGFGVSFGVLADTAGVGGTAAAAMSLTTFAGSAQFAAVSILGAGGGVAAAVVAAVLLNARYVALGVSVASAFAGPASRRLLESQLVIDESWALGTTAPGRFDRRLLLGAGGVCYVVWNLGTLIGVLGAGVLGDPTRLGLDAAFPALFLALLVSQLRSRRAVLAAALGALVAVALVPIAPLGVPIIAAAAVPLLGLRR
jgi:4-azaleucine resistance transporter AzlC